VVTPDTMASRWAGSKGWLKNSSRTFSTNNWQQRDFADHFNLLAFQNSANWRAEA